MGKYFGTDGIRGEAYVTLLPELAYKIGQALSLLENNDVLIAWDTRISSIDFVNSIKDGAVSAGLHVHLIGVIPTPGLIKASRDLKMLGVMITASHNPYTDNGIKVIKEGYKINDIDKKKIEDYLDNGQMELTNDGRFDNINYQDNYLSFLASNSIKTNISVVLDAANGASSEYAKIYEEISPRVKIVANKPNGYNINNNVGATHIDNIKKEIADYDLGISLDGDADRVIIIDKEEVYDGDKIIYLFAKYFKKKNMLTNNTVVLTKMSNLGVISQLNDEGINVVLTDVGDQNVIDEMNKNNYALGGENSGHIITPFSKTGDGLLNGIILLRILEEEKKTIKQLTQSINMYYDKMINIKVKDKNIINALYLKEKVKKIEESFGKYGKVILRASGTENLIRVTVMHKDKDVMEKNLAELVEIVNNLNRE